MKAYILYQYRSTVNKISLVCHDGTQEGKDMLIHLLTNMLRKPGYVIEASNAMSWVLRKHNIPYFTDIDMIKHILDIGSSQSENIIINHNFDPSDKRKQYYIHQYIDNGIVTFANSDTLFGSSPCVFIGYLCDRKCQEPKQQEPKQQGGTTYYKQKYLKYKTKYMNVQHIWG